MSKAFRCFSRFLFLVPVLIPVFAQQPSPQNNSQSPAQVSPGASGAANTSQSAEISGPSTVLKVKTRLVVVDVVAQDSKGQAITDLKAQDFTVTEDGKSQEVRVFTLQQPSTENKGQRPEIATLPADTVTNLPRYQTTVWNVVMLDALNSTLPDQAYMRDEMVKFLGRLPSDQPVAIYLLGTKLRLIQDFTSDPALLKQAIATIKNQASPVINNPAGTSPETDIPQGSAAAAVLASAPLLREQILAFQEEHSAAETDFQVQYTLKALNSLGRTLAGYPGRKNLIWISEAFPFDILSTRNNNTRDYSYNVAATGSLLSDAQVAIYPIDARGLLNRSAYSVGTDSNPLIGQSATSTRLDSAMGATMNAEANALMAAHTTMNDLADKTGGRAFYNTNDLAGKVQESLRDGSTYYTLAYYPENKNWNGDFRKIHVKVNRSGVKLRYRLGYFADDRTTFTKESQAKQDQDLDQALSLDWPVATALPFTATVQPPSAETQNKVVVRYRIDSHGLNFDQGQDGLRHVSVLCAVRAFTTKDHDKIVKAEGYKLEGPLRPEAYAKVANAFFPCQEAVELPPGNYLLRLGVRDNSTGLIGTATAQIAVPPSTAGAVTKPDEKKP